MRNRIPAALSRCFLFLAVGFLMLSSSFVRAQNNSKLKCEWTWKYVWEHAWETRYNVMRNRYEPQQVYKQVYKRVYDCVPTIGDTTPTTSSVKKSNSNIVPSKEEDQQRVFKFFQAIKLMEEKKYREAIEAYTAVLNLTANDDFVTDAYLGRGDAELELKKYREAIADYDRAIRIYSKWEIEEKARPANGEITLRNFVLDRDYPRAYHNRGVAKHFLGDKIGASHDFRKACSLGFKEGC